MKRVLLRCQVALLLAVSIFYAQSVVAQEESSKVKDCSKASLKGAFAYTSTGFIVAAPIPSIIGPAAEVGTQYFDGKGGITFTFNSSQNGNVGPGTATGTYTVNDDCTGTFTEATPMFTAHFSFVIDKSGDHLQAICQDAGVVDTRIGRRQFPGDDGER